jgi:hypothetical protein
LVGGFILRKQNVASDGRPVVPFCKFLNIVLYL